MGKALKPLVIVLLLLSVISLILGSMLFSKREILKDRTLKHEEAVKKIAQNLRFENLDVAQLKDSAALPAQLDLVAVAAENQYEALQNTKQDLANKEEELATTKNELSDTKVELAETQNKVTELNESLEQKDAELVLASGRVTQLEQDKTTLQIQVDDINNQLVRSEDEMKDCQDKVNTLEKILKDLDDGLRKPRPTGLTGHILLVNPAWNFVILDIGSEQGVVANAEMLVHRDDKFIGKVLVNQVDKNLSVAEIMVDWRQKPVREGDYVLF